MLKITAVPAFKDNYIWVIQAHGSKYCAIVDPGEAEPVVEFLQKRQLRPIAILITHHHWDHTNGIKLLLQRYDIPVYGPAPENVPHGNNPLKGGEQLPLTELNLDLKVLAIPGHTKDHLAYYGDGIVLTGDTLFTAGCGRVFEGTIPMMYASLAELAALPAETLVYCGHEYTANNLKFAAAVEPNNPEIQARIQYTNWQREQGLPTVPASLATELATNPFLRCKKNTVFSAAERFSGQKPSDSIEVFSILRHWKDNF